MHCVNLENVKCSSTPIIFYGAVIFKVISLRTWLREKARYFQPPNLNFVNKNRAITVQMWKDWIRALRWIPTRRWVVINISWWYCCTQIAKQIDQLYLRHSLTPWQTGNLILKHKSVPFLYIQYRKLHL